MSFLWEKINQLELYYQGVLVETNSDLTSPIPTWRLFSLFTYTMVREPPVKDLLRVMSPSPICKSAIVRVTPKCYLVAKSWPTLLRPHGL